MERMWADILERYGQDVILRGAETAACKAMLQPLTDREGEQETASPLGLGRRDRFRYLGPAQYPLDLDTVVEWKGAEYRVGSAHLMGEDICPHWRAILYPREEVTE